MIPLSAPLVLVAAVVRSMRGPVRGNNVQKNPIFPHRFAHQAVILDVSNLASTAHTKPIESKAAQKPHPICDSNASPWVGLNVLGKEGCE